MKKDKNNYMSNYCEADKYYILETIEAFSKTIYNRLLPTFESLEEEAKEIERKSLEKAKKTFHPDVMDEADVYENAYHDGVSHYLLYKDMKIDFLNSAVTWLFHMFEKDCTRIFKTTSGDKKKEQLVELSIDTAKGSLWKNNNHELRHLANTIKHGDGWSCEELKKIRPDLFKDHLGEKSPTEIEVPLQDFESYINDMKKFWELFFSKTIPANYINN